MRIYGLSKDILNIDFNEDLDAFTRTEVTNQILQNVQIYFEKILGLNSNFLYVLIKV